MEYRGLNLFYSSFSYNIDNKHIMIFVTGGTGMLGAHLLFDLTLYNDKVIAIKRESSHINITKTVFEALSKEPKQQLSKIEWREADLNDFSSIFNAMKECKYVYHAAAFVSFDTKDKALMLENNINGTANVINSALDHKIEKFCHISSIAALGESTNNELITENSKRSQTFKHSNYSESKYKSELEVWRGINEGLNAVILNPSVILGIGDWNKGSAAMFSKVNSGLKFYTHGGTGFVDARDVSKASILLMNSTITNQRFIINSQNLPYRKVFDLIAENISKPKPSIFANKFLAGMAWRMEAIKSYLFNSKPLLTKETVESAQNTKKYSNENVKKAINVDFIEIQDTIKFMSHFFNKYSKT